MKEKIKTILRDEVRNLVQSEAQRLGLSLTDKVAGYSVLFLKEHGAEIPGRDFSRVLKCFNPDAIIDLQIAIGLRIEKLLRK